MSYNPNNNGTEQFKQRDKSKVIEMTEMTEMNEELNMSKLSVMNEMQDMSEDLQQKEAPFASIKKEKLPDSKVLSGASDVSAEERSVEVKSSWYEFSKPAEKIVDTLQNKGYSATVDYLKASLSKSYKIMGKRMVSDEAFKTSYDRVQAKNFRKKLEKDKDKAVTTRMMDRFVGAFKNWKGKLDSKKIMSSRDRDKRLLLIAGAYEDVSSQYRELYKSNEQYMPEDVKAMFGELEEARLRVEANNYSELDKKKEELKAKIGANALEKEKVNEEDHHGAEEPLSEAQMKGVADIDKWLVRNVSKGDSNQDKSGLVASVLSMSPRERLFIYYIICEKRRYNPNMTDVDISQEYVVDLDTFRNRMVAHPFRIFKRLMNKNVYWDKLGQAIRIKNRSSERLAVYTDPSLKVEREKKREEFEQKQAEEFEQQYRAATESNNTDEVQRLSKIKEQRAARRAAFDDVISFTRQLREKITSAKPSKKEEAALREEFSGKLEKLVKCQKSLVDLGGTKTAVKGDADADITDDQMMDYGMTGYEVANTFGPGLVSSILSNKAFTEEGEIANLEALVSFQKASLAQGAFLTVSSLAAFVGFLAAFGGMISEGSSMTNSERTKAALGLIAAAGGVVASVSGTVASIAIGKMTLETAEASMKTVANATTVATVSGYALMGISAAISISEAVGISRSKTHLHSSARKFGYRLDKNGMVEGHDTLEQRVLRLGERKRLARRQQLINSVIGLGAGCLAFIPTGPVAAALIGAGIAVLPLVLDHVTSKEKALHRDTAHDFYDSDRFMKEAEELAKQKGGELTEKEKQELKNEILQTTAEKLGYASYADMYMHVVDEQAEELHTKIFYDDNGEYITEERYKSDATIQQRTAKYKEMLKGFGLKLKFGKSPEDSRPSLEKLIAKLKG